ncbi:MAG: response regulator [Deltaproteobacteria bacterium]|nr:response regulator [Deltaproteobacteria bacterium]
MMSPKIMIVDDEPTTIEVLSMFLEAQGYTDLVVTTRADRALDLLVRETPDLLLLNLVMPGQSGLDILRAMRSDASLRAIPVVIVTSSTDPKARAEAFELGAVDFLPKPVDPSELALRVRNILAAEAQRGPGPTGAVSPDPQPEASRPTAEPEAAGSGSGPVESRLAGDPRFRAVLAKFARRLEERLDAMDERYEVGDFDALVGLAHWLAGAAGTVGFDAFAEPAAELKRLASQHKAADVQVSLRGLRALAERMVIPRGDGSRPGHDEA